MEREQEDRSPQQILREELKALGERMQTANSEAEREKLMDESVQLRKRLEELEGSTNE